MALSEQLKAATRQYPTMRETALWYSARPSPMAAMLERWERNRQEWRAREESRWADDGGRP